jgi:hypothetical protein
MSTTRRNRSFAGRGKSTGLADTGHLAAYANRPDRQPVVARVNHDMMRRKVGPDEVRK